MQLPASLVPLALQLATQLNPSQGTASAQRGAVQRLADPTMYDIIFPVLAFVLVIILPSVTALWVIWRTLTEQKAEADEG